MKITLVIILLCLSRQCHSQTVNDLRPTVTMKEYVDMQADLNRKVSEVQFQNILDNVNKANSATEKRFDGVNEFRLQLKDQAGTFITRQELFAWIVAIIGIFFGYMNWKKGQKEVAKLKTPI